MHSGAILGSSFPDFRDPESDAIRAQVLLVEPFDLGDGSDLGNHTLYNLPEGRCSLETSRIYPLVMTNIAMENGRLQ